MEEESDFAVGRVPDAGFADDFGTSARGVVGVGEDDCEIEDAGDGGGEQLLEAFLGWGFLGVGGT